MIFILHHEASTHLPLRLQHKSRCRASQVALVVKNPAANAGDIRDADWIPRSGRSSEGGHGNPLQYSCLENLIDRGAWQATVHRVSKSHTWLSDLAHMHKSCYMFCSTSEFHSSHGRMDSQINIKVMRQESLPTQYFTLPASSFQGLLRVRQATLIEKKGIFLILCSLPFKSLSGRTKESCSPTFPHCILPAKKKTNAKDSVCAQVWWSSTMEFKHHLLGNSQLKPRWPLPPLWTYHLPLIGCMVSVFLGDSVVKNPPVE